MSGNLPLKAETIAFFESVSGKTVRYAGPTRRIGCDVEEAKARECAEWAAQLIADVRAWVKKNRPDLS